MTEINSFLNKYIFFNFVDPELIDIPNSMDEVIKMLGSDQYKSHPGLHAARKSYRNKRSSKNAYILLVGSTGAGKSSAVSCIYKLCKKKKKNKFIFVQNK